MQIVDRLRQENVSRLDLSHFASCAADSAVADVLKLMRTERISAVFITEGADLLGVFTERDVLTKIADAPENVEVIQLESGAGALVFIVIEHEYKKVLTDPQVYEAWLLAREQEVEAQKEKNAGKGKKAEVAKASVQAVEVQKEEVEQIDELSKATLGSYVKKSKADAKAHYQDFKSGKNSPDPEDRRLSMHSLGQHVKRTQGLKRADARLGNPIGVFIKKEEVEQIDEISKELAGKYLTAPQGKGANKYKTGEGESTYPNWSALSKHQKNVKRALQRSGSSSLNKKPSYYKEDVEQLDEKLPASASAGDYIHDFVHSDNPKFAGKSTKERQKMALGAFYAKNKGK